MTAGANTIGRGASTTNRSVVFSVMRSARSWFQHKPSVELAAIIGCDVRTAERYFAGERAPDAAAIFAILGTEAGVKLIEARTHHLAPADYDKFWKAMGQATLRAFVRENNESVT